MNYTIGFTDGLVFRIWYFVSRRCAVDSSTKYEIPDSKYEIQRDDLLLIPLLHHRQNRRDRHRLTGFVIYIHQPFDNALRDIFFISFSCATFSFTVSRTPMVIPG
jgi:hypothetical protein